MLRAEPIDWRTSRPAYAHELEAGFAPEVDKHPWLAPEQMALARKVMENEIRKHQRGIRDRTGERYGRMVVVGLARMSGKTSTWRCRCDCGNMRTISSGNLNKTRRSCGCLKLEAVRNNQRLAVAALARKRAAKNTEAAA